MRPLPPEIPGISDWRPLARGGFSTVWQARQETLDRPVAVKVDERTLDSETERLRFLGEARTAGNLSGHPGIVTVHDAGILPDGRPYLVMKLCTGGSLTRWLRPENRQTPERVRVVGVRIADALAAAHAQGMLHRDVKPANILIDSYDHAGLADFGLAVASESGPSEGLTLSYAPPEALRREPATEFGDVYQLAATLYALLCGHPPREAVGGRVSLEDLVARLDEPVQPLWDVDERLMQVLLDGLAPDPADRPTAAQFRDRLAALDLTPGAASGAKAVLGASTRRRRWVVTLAVATVLCLLGLTVAGSGVYLYEIDRSVTANISRGLSLPPEGSGAAKRPDKDPQAQAALNYVLIGNDDGDPELDKKNTGRSDSFMLVHLNSARDQAYVVSVPPDTYVDLPGPGKGRITAAYANGDEALVVRTLEKMTNVRMDHVVKVNFQGFVNLTNELGGVTVRNRKPFSFEGSDYPAGEISLQGERALRYVRVKNRQVSETERAEHQRDMLKAVLTKGLSGAVVADPLKFTRFIGNAAKQIQVDNELTDAELRSTAVSLRLRPDEVKLLSVPLEQERKKGSTTVRDLEEEQFEELALALRTDTMADYVEKHPKG